MKITFLLSYAGMSGGIRVIAIYTKLLREMGHQVNIISMPKQPLPFISKIKALFGRKQWLFGKTVQGPSHFDKDDPFWTRIDHYRPLNDGDVPDGDIVIATWWRTAVWANQLSSSKGKKVYFCQHYEVHDYLPQKQVEATYFFPMAKICVSSWVKNKIEQLTGENNQQIAMNGVQLNQFHAPVREKNDVPVFGFMYNPVYWKGTDIIVEALELAKLENPQLKAVCFGLKKPTKKDLFLPNWITFYEHPSQDFIREIYAKCDAWLFGSRAEGFGLPLLEAMACRAPVIATNAGAAPELVSEDCGFIVPQEDSQMMSKKILELSAMEASIWREMSDSAYRKACDNDWHTAASTFELILVEQLEPS